MDNEDNSQEPQSDHGIFEGHILLTTTRYFEIGCFLRWQIRVPQHADARFPLLPGMDQEWGYLCRAICLPILFAN